MLQVTGPLPPILETYRCSRLLALPGPALAITTCELADEDLAFSTTLPDGSVVVDNKVPRR